MSLFNLLMTEVINMVQVAMYTASGEAHGLVNTLTNSCEDNGFKHFKPEYKTQMEKERKEDNRIVEVEYINKKGRHERLDKHYCRHSGDPILKYHLIPGYTYKVPMGMVKEVNGMENMKRSDLLEVDGNKVTKDGTPLAKDEKADWEHKLIPVGFK